jgi:hypothetical protein
MSSAATEIVGGCRLRNRGQVQDFEPGVAFQDVTNEVVDMDPLQ